jgi:hypothetical protein
LVIRLILTLLPILGQSQGSNKLRNRIDVCDVIRFVSMTSLGSRAAPDCRTGQNKGRYCARALQSYSLVYFFLGQSHKGWVLKMAKVPLQLSFKHSKPFLALYLHEEHFLFFLHLQLLKETSQNLSGK